MSRNFPLRSKKFSSKGRSPRIEEPVSAGGVVYRVVDGQVETVLCGRVLTGGVSPEGEEDQRGVHGYQGDKVRWSLAKGTPDPGESLEETALREVREETGLEVEIQEPIASIDYWFADRGSDIRYHKTVHFYLMAPLGGDTDQHDPEFDVIQWFPSEEALKNLSYANEADVLRRALELISKRKGGG